MENNLRDINISITCASYSGNKGAAAMIQSSIEGLYARYGHRLNVNLMSVYPDEDEKLNPHDFVKIVNAKPEKVVFLEFPLAVLFFLLKWIPGIKKLFNKNRMIKAYRSSDLVIDEAGISFVDSRGFVMNTYAFITMAIPKLLGVPVMKYSQAMGSFDRFWNRLLAGIILPKLDLICARGEATRKHLAAIGIKDNVRLCADGAFVMEDDSKLRDRIDAETERDAFFYDKGKGIVGVSISSVVDSKCAKIGIDYRKKMVAFIDYLCGRGYKVYIIANATRMNSKKARNNDLMVCDSIYRAVEDETNVRWNHKEMSPEEIREYIGKCRFIVASRFHAMIGALERKVPVLLIGWSHKYREVLDMFDLSEFCFDYRMLSEEAGRTEKNSFAEEKKHGFLSLSEGFERLESEEVSIRERLAEHYGQVIESSRDNIRYAVELIEKIISKKKNLRELIEISNPEKYLGYDVLYCKRGYATDDKIRENAASGGVVTALLVSLLKQKKIDGAFVTRTEINDGRLGYKSFIATTEEEIKGCSSSVYLYMPLLKELENAASSFNGRIAVVLTPCMLTGLNTILDRNAELRGKIVLKLGLYCSGNQTEEATLFSLEKAGVTLDKASRLYYRRGFWRGRSSVIYRDGSRKDFSYKKTICAYKNAYYFEKKQCMLCQDQFANNADISFGDIWLKEMKKERYKNTGCIIRTETGRDMYEAAIAAGDITDRHMSFSELLRGQKRALVFKYNAAASKFRYYSSEGRKVRLDTLSKCTWNHSLAFRLAESDRIYSEKHPDRLKRKPMLFIYLKMCFIRFLLNF